MDSSDSVLKVSVDGAAYADIMGGGGGGSLDAAYLLGSQIDVIDANGPVILDTAQTIGDVLLISSSAAPTLTAPLTGISVDMAGVDPNGFALTGVSINMTTGTPGTSVITGLSITGASSTKAKARKQALLYVNSRASAASAAQFIVRNTSATAGSLILVGWDDVDFSGVTQNSVLAGVTHMLTLDGQTNVTAGAQEFVGARILVPASSSPNTFGIEVDTNQRAGIGMFIDGSGTLSGTFTAISARLSGYGAGLTNAVVGLNLRLPASTNTNSCAIDIETNQTTGHLIYGEFTNTTALSDTFTGCYMNLSDSTPGAHAVIGYRAAIPASTSSSTIGISVESNQTAGSLLKLTASGTLTTSITGITVRLNSIAGGLSNPITGMLISNPASTNALSRILDLETLQTIGTLAKIAYSGGTTLSGASIGVSVDMSTNVTAGAQEVVGVNVLTPASTNTSTHGVRVSASHTAGAFFAGLATTTISMTESLVGVAIDLLTGITTNNRQIVAFSSQVAESSHAAARGITITGRVTNAAASVAEFILTTTATSSSSNVVYLENTTTTVSVSAVTGCLLLGVVNGNSARGIRVQTSSGTGVHVGSLGSFVRAGSWTGGGTESGSIFTVSREFFVNSGGTLTAPIATFSSTATLIGGTLTYSANEVSIVRAPTYSGGTLNLSGALLSLTHAPSGTVATDTTAFIVGTTIAQSGTMVAFTSTGTLAGTLVMLALAAAGVTPGAHAVVGASITIPASSSAATRGITITSTQTAATSSVAEFLLSAGSASQANIIYAVGNANHQAASGTTGYIAYLEQQGPAGRGIKVTTSTFTGAHTGGNLMAVWRSGTWSGGGTETTNLSEIHRDYAITASAVINAPMFSVHSFPTCTVGTLTYATSDVQIIRGPTCTSGTVNMSGSVLAVTHAPTGGGVGTDTTTGLLVTMTPASVASVVGVSINMANASAQGAALTIAHSGTNANQLAFTSAVDGTGAHIYGPLVGQLNIFAGQRADAGRGRDIAIYASDGVSSTNGGGDVLLSGGDPVSTGSYGYVKAQTAFAEANAAVTYTSGGTTTINVSLGNAFTSTASGGATTWAFANPPSTGIYAFTLVLTDGGSQTQNWPASVKWPGGAAPVLTVSGVDVLVFFTLDGGTTWRGSLSQADSS